MNIRLMLSVGLFSAAAIAQTPLLIDQPVAVGGPLPGLGVCWAADLDGPGPGWRVADGFKTAVPGEQLVLNFSIWGAWGGGSPAPTATDTFEVSFREDSTFPLGAAVFGAVPHYEGFVTFTGLAPTNVTATGSTIAIYANGAWGAAPLYRLDFDLPVPVSVTPNCYDNWLSIASENSPNHTFGWAVGSVSANGNSNLKSAGKANASAGWANNVFPGASSFAMQIGAVPTGNPTLCVPELISDAVSMTTIPTSLANATPNSLAVWAVSGGDGPVPTQWGQLLLDPGFILLSPVMLTDGLGNAASSFDVPPGFNASGIPLYFQGLDLGQIPLNPLTFRLTNGVTKLVH